MSFEKIKTASEQLDIPLHLVKRLSQQYKNTPYVKKIGVGKGVLVIDTQWLSNLKEENLQPNEPNISPVSSDNSSNEQNYNINGVNPADMLITAKNDHIASLENQLNELKDQLDDKQKTIEGLMAKVPSDENISVIIKQFQALQGLQAGQNYSGKNDPVQAEVVKTSPAPRTSSKSKANSTNKTPVKKASKAKPKMSAPKPIETKTKWWKRKK
jgi:hypothetical protein